MRVLTSILTALAQLLYSALRLLPLRNKVVFLSRQSDSVSRDFRMLADELRARDDRLEVVIRCKAVGETFPARIGYLGELLAQLYHLATARVCIADGHVIPVGALRHRSSLTVVQMWHALGAIKKFGYQALDRPSGRSSELAESLKMHRNYDYVLCGGPATIRVFAEAFGVAPEIVEPLGLPRVDYLRSHAAEAGGASEAVVGALKDRFPALADEKRVRILYVPTFRKGGPTGFDEVARRFGAAPYALMAKPHDLEQAELPADSVIDVSGISVLDLLLVSDVVITDYSAVAFEAGLLDLPLYFFVYDIDEYRDRQGLNIDPLVELPDISSKSIDEIGTWIDAKDYDFETIRAWSSPYLPSSEDVCTGRIADLVAQHLGGGTP